MDEEVEELLAMSSAWGDRVAWKERIFSSVGVVEIDREGVGENVGLAIF